MKKGVVIKAFPYAFDGINIVKNAVNSAFPPEGFSVADSTFDGLVDAGYIEATTDGELSPQEDLNRRIIESIDQRLSVASDQELKDIIARSGKPYSGNMIHARLVFAAKSQLQAEMAGAVPVSGVDPNAGVTEKPRSKPGEATPPSAAAAIQGQKANTDAAKGDDAKRFDDAAREDALAKASDNGKTAGEPDQPQPSSQQSTGELTLDDMTIAELKDHAEKQGVDLGDATKKAEIIDAIKASDKK